MTRVEYGGTIESIKELLSKYHLTGFSSIVLKPTWCSKSARKQFENCSTIVGNFIEYSNAFYIITDDKDVINDFKPYFRRKVSEKAFQKIIDTDPDWLYDKDYWYSGEDTKI